MQEKQREAQQHEAHLQAQINRFEAPKERAGRDFRKQTIMKTRTLFLENLMQTFMLVLLSVVPRLVSLEPILKLLFEWSGSRIERDKTVIYGMNTTGLSRGNRRRLGEIVEGFNAMGFVETGKPVRVCLTELPP